MDQNWLSLHVILVIFHVLGSIVGAGAAYMGDIIFLTTVKRKVFTASDIRIFNTISTVVWIGLLLIFLSGTGLVLQRPEIFFYSGKFWAKMTVVVIIVVNGLAFHLQHRPIFSRMQEERFTPKSEIIKKRIPLLISGAISVLSWNFVIVLGVLGRTPFAYWQFFGVYLVLLSIACAIAITLRNKILTP